MEEAAASRGESWLTLPGPQAALLGSLVAGVSPSRREMSSSVCPSRVVCRPLGPPNNTSFTALLIRFGTTTANVCSAQPRLARREFAAFGHLLRSTATLEVASSSSRHSEALNCRLVGSQSLLSKGLLRGMICCRTNHTKKRHSSTRTVRYGVLRYGVGTECRVPESPTTLSPPPAVRAALWRPTTIGAPEPLSRRVDPMSRPHHTSRRGQSISRFCGHVWML